MSFCPCKTLPLDAVDYLYPVTTYSGNANIDVAVVTDITLLSPVYQANVIAVKG